MLLDSWNPFFDVAKTMEEFDRFFGTADHPIGLRSVPRGTFPPINIYNEDDTTILLAEVPGLKAEDIELAVLGNAVTLKGQRKEEPEKDERFYRKERPLGSFLRTVTLPDAVDPDSVKASYCDGLLKVQMHKAQQAKPKKIQIKA